MECPRCRSGNPDVALYCFRCGQSLRGPDATRGGRGNAWAVQSSENVTQLALISTIMPHTNRQAADNYRWALLATGVLVLATTLAGLIPMAILAAAFLVPVTYLIYIYDVNLWEDQPLSVVVGVFLFTGILSLLISALFFHWLFAEQARLAVFGGRAGVGIPVGSLLIFAVLLPIVAEVAKNVGPVFLASRPAFDDMIDGLTFGVAAGTAYAAFETIVQHWGIFTAGSFRTTDGLASWLPIILNLMIVKSLIYGTATGIAVAAFSGRGEGYDGFTPSYFANFAFAAGMNVLYWVGVRLLAQAPFGNALGLLWGLIILAFLVIRVRLMLHTALLEAAVEDAANQRRHKSATTVTAFCPECEMQLLADALFCIVCGESVRAHSSAARHHIRDEPPGGVA